MGIIFRPTTPPDQERFIDPFTPLTNTDTNKITRLLLAPVFRPEPSTKVLPIVCPGGYKGTECFRATFQDNLLTLGPGYLVMDEVLLESKDTISLDVSKSSSYFDSIPKSNQPYDGYSGFSGTSGISGASGQLGYGIATIYVLAYYYPYPISEPSFDPPNSNSGYSGDSGYYTNNYQTLVLGLSSNKNTYINNRDRYCFLYSVEVAFYNNTPLYIESVNYYDEDNSHMKRHIPNFIEFSIS